MTSEFWSGDEYDAEAQRFYESGDYDGALDILKHGLTLFPDSTELIVSMGYTRLAREEYPWARRSFERVLVREPDHEEALAGLGEALLKLGERGRAFRAFERILELGFAKDAELMLCVGRSLLREGLLARAERFFRLALTADPSSADAALDLAYVRYREDDIEGALKWSREAVRLDPAFEDARAMYGNLLYERGDFRSALAHLERIPPGAVSDPVIAWRIVELMRRLRGLAPDSDRVRPYMLMLDELSTEPGPEERLLAELEAGAEGRSITHARGQLDLFGRPSIIADGEWHRVRGPDGGVYEGDWEAIVRAMRDRGPDPTVSLEEFMQQEARRLADLTGVLVPFDDPRAFLEGSARLGALEIER